MVKQESMMGVSEQCVQDRMEVAPRELSPTKRESVAQCRDTPGSAALDALVIATDFSQHAAHAVGRVAMLAEEGNMCTATVLHVLEDSALTAFREIFKGSPNTASQRSVAAKRQLAGVANQLRQRTGLAVESRVATGGTVKTIQCFAGLADFLVIGAQGTHPVRDFLIGSTAQRLLRDASPPILIVKRRPEAPYRRVLIAVDFQSDPNNALDYAEMLAPRAALNLVHVYHVPFAGKIGYAGVSDDVIDAHRAEARASAARNMTALVLSRTSPAVKRTFIVHGHAARKLLEHERALKADLVIVSRRDKTLTEELLLESVVPRLLAESQCDVLVVR
jgi:nucleotide-binding universal stress UspA family protein